MRRLGDILELKDADRALASRAIAGLAFDSRKTAPGDVFFALAGAKDDGLKHVGEAVAKGAAAIVAERWAETPNAAFVKVADARAALAHAAARFYPRQPETIVAVTGTSGKTSVAAFVRQIWQALGREAASIGTIGVVSRPLTVYGSLTTPDPIALHELLDRLASNGVTNLAIEASSHGLDQKRLDGVRLAAGAFTNLTRDHMDYHATVEDYLAAKLRLFQDLLPDGAPAVIDADSAIAPRVIAAARARGLKVVTVGVKGETIRLNSAARDGLSSVLDLQFGGRSFRVNFPLGRRLSDLQRAGRRRPLHRHGQRGGCGVRSAANAGRRAGTPRAHWRYPRRDASLSTTRISPTRSRRRSPRCGRSCAGVSSWCSVAAATAIRASGRSWARSPRAAPT